MQVELRQDDFYIKINMGYIYIVAEGAASHYPLARENSIF